jgi:hypothetical protein
MASLRAQESGGTPAGTALLRDRLTVVVTTSPVPSNPSTAMIEELFQSFAMCPGLSACRKIIVCDGFNVGDSAKCVCVHALALAHG